MEAFFEGAENANGASDNFNSKRIVLREMSAGNTFTQTNRLLPHHRQMTAFSLTFKMSST